MELNFSVKEQTLTFNNPDKKVVANSQNYLTAKFTFCDDWKNATPITSIFVSASGEVYNIPLDENGVCEVPWEVIFYPHFTVSVFGGDRITANKAVVPVTKSGYALGDSSKNPTPDPYKILVEQMNKRIDELQKIVNKLAEKSLVKTVTINLPASEWVGNDDVYYQVIPLENVTPYSKIDLQPTVEQLEIFHEKDIAFVTENDNGVVRVYCIGQKPIIFYAMQATITEVETDE